MTLSPREPHRDRQAAGVLSGLAGWLGLGGRRGVHDRRHALAQLAAMEDWQLADVGLTRQRLERELATAGLRADGRGAQMHLRPRSNRAS